VVGKKYVRIMKYDPSKPQHLRYSPEAPTVSEEQLEEMTNICTMICKSLGTDFNVVEFGISKNVIYTVDFLNPLPLAERSYLLEENFNWLVRTTSEFLVEVAREGKKQIKDYAWNEFIGLVNVQGKSLKEGQMKVKAKRRRRRKSKVERVRVYPGKEF
jgi:hypothetical protein